MTNSTAKRRNENGRRVQAMRGYLRSLGIAVDADTKTIDDVRQGLHEQFGTSRTLSRHTIRAKIADALGRGGRNGDSRAR